MWEEVEPAESFQPPDVGESPTGEIGEFGPPPSFVFFFLRNPKVMVEERTKSVEGESMLPNQEIGVFVDATAALVNVPQLNGLTSDSH